MVTDWKLQTVVGPIASYYVDASWDDGAVAPPQTDGGKSYTLVQGEFEHSYPSGGTKTINVYGEYIGYYDDMGVWNLYQSFTIK